MQERRNVDINFGSSILGVLTMVLIFVGLFYIVGGIGKILGLIAPILIVATAIIDHKVLLNYGKWLLNLLRKDILMGIGGVLLTVIGFPFVVGFLFVKALLYRKVKKMNKEFEGESAGDFLEYEEINDDISSPLELPTFEKEAKQTKKSNDYEQLFGEDL